MSRLFLRFYLLPFLELKRLQVAHRSISTFTYKYDIIKMFELVSNLIDIIMTRHRCNCKIFYTKHTVYRQKDSTNVRMLSRATARVSFGAGQKMNSIVKELITISAITSAH